MSVKTMFEDVLAFHRKFRPELIGATPAPPDGGPERTELRIRLMREELDETAFAMQSGNLEGVADGIADLIYVALGAAVTYGIDLPEVWSRVHAANMAKQKENGRPDGKVTKPPGWTPPDVAGALASQLSLHVLYPDEQRTPD